MYVYLAGGAGKNLEICREYNIRFAFNLDTNDLKETWENQSYLENNTSAYIVPIYHYQSWMAEDFQWLNHLKRYPFVSAGGMVGEKRRSMIKAFLSFLYSIFGKKRLHLLGKTSEDILKTFPAYTVDSSNWVMGQKYLNILTDNHLSNLTKFRQSSLDPYERIRIDMKLYHELEMKMTSLWCHRGIHFGCPHDEMDFIARKDGHELARSLIRKT